MLYNFQTLVFSLYSTFPQNLSKIYESFTNPSSPSEVSYKLLIPEEKYFILPSSSLKADKKYYFSCAFMSD